MLPCSQAPLSKSFPRHLQLALAHTFNYRTRPSPPSWQHAAATDWTAATVQPNPEQKTEIQAGLTSLCSTVTAPDLLAWAKVAIDFNRHLRTRLANCHASTFSVRQNGGVRWLGTLQRLLLPGASGPTRQQQPWRSNTAIKDSRTGSRSLRSSRIRWSQSGLRVAFHSPCVYGS